MAGIDWKRGILPSIGYKINKWFFLPSLFVMIGLILLSGFLYGWKPHLGLTCKGDSFCSNPLSYSCERSGAGYCFDFATMERVCTSNPALCRMELLSPGFVLDPEPPLQKMILPIFFVMFLIGGLLNHFLLNRNFKSKIKLEGL